MDTVLVVDDDMLVCFDLAQRLENEGYNVLTAANADKAIAILERRDDIRTIFTDIDMPGSMDGLKLAAAVRDKWPPVNIIVTTGMTAPPREALPRGSMFIPKPYRHRQVLEALRALA